VDVELRLKNGVRHRLHVDYPRGAPQNPATRAEREAKFDAVAAPALTGPCRARVRSAGRDLERLTSLTDLMDALVAEGSASRAPGVMEAAILTAVTERPARDEVRLPDCRSAGSRPAATSCRWSPWST